jgi:nitrate/TMAO reductase-like tetraheme cytochrome c subunit
MTKKGRGVLYLIGAVLIVLGCLFFFGATHSVQSQEESTCISCHTSVKELVRITREIAAKSPPQKSAESKGEG